MRDGRWVTPARDLLARRQRIHSVVTKARGRSAPFVRAAHPLHRTAYDNVFFIVGSGRSGTTLVRRILMSCSSVHIPPEFHVVGRLVATYRQYGYLPWARVVDLCLAQLAFHPEFTHFAISPGSIAEKVRTLPRERQSLADVILAVFQAHAEAVDREEATVFGEKTPNTTEHAYEVLATFPKARFVHVIRDGLDVATSFAETGMFPLEDAARLWARRTRIARRFATRYPDACITVRYEDLVAQPEAVVRRLAAFLDIPWDCLDIEEVGHVESMGDVAEASHHERVRQTIDVQQMGRWRGRLSRDEVRMLLRIMDRERRKWGYGSIEVPTASRPRSRLSERLRRPALRDEDRHPLWSPRAQRP